MIHIFIVAVFIILFVSLRMLKHKFEDINYFHHSWIEQQFYIQNIDNIIKILRFLLFLYLFFVIGDFILKF